MILYIIYYIYMYIIFKNIYMRNLLDKYIIKLANIFYTYNLYTLAAGGAPPVKKVFPSCLLESLEN